MCADLLATASFLLPHWRIYLNELIHYARKTCSQIVDVTFKTSFNRCKYLTYKYHRIVLFKILISLKRFIPINNKHVYFGALVTTLIINCSILNFIYHVNVTTCFSEICTSFLLCFTLWITYFSWYLKINIFLTLVIYANHIERNWLLNKIFSAFRITNLKYIIPN